MFTKTFDICVHSPHEGSWNFISELGLEEDRSFRVADNCQEPRDPPRSTQFQATQFQSGVSSGFSVPAGQDSNIHILHWHNFLTGHDYIDRTDIRIGKGEEKKNHNINLGALYRKPLEQGVQQQQTVPDNNNNYLLGLLYKHK